MSLCITVCNIGAGDISRGTRVWDATLGKSGLEEGTPQET